MFKLFYKRMPFKADVIITFLNGMVVLIGIFLLNGFISRVYGLEALGEFLLIKNTFSTIAGTIMIGLNIGLPYYLSKNKDRNYGDSSFTIIVFITIPLSIVVIMSLLYFNIEGFTIKYFWVYFIYLNSIVIQLLTFGLFRGYFNMVGANIIQLITTALIPFLVFVMTDDIYNAIYIIGLSVIFFSFISFSIRNHGIKLWKISAFHMKKLLNYGTWRIPGFLSQFILLAFIPLILANWTNLETVAYFNSSLSLVKLVLVFINPLTVVLLPHLIEKTNKGQFNEISGSLNVLFRLIIVTSVIITSFIIAYTLPLFDLWLGNVKESSTFILRLTIITLPFYTLSGLARSPINAASEKGYSSIVYGVGAISMLLTLFIGWILGFDFKINAIISFAIGQIITGIISIHVVKRFFSLHIFNTSLFKEVGIAIIFIFMLKGTTSVFIKSELLQMFISFIIIVSLCSLFFLKGKSEWVVVVRKKIFSRQ